MEPATSIGVQFDGPTAERPTILRSEANPLRVLTLVGLLTTERVAARKRVATENAHRLVFVFDGMHVECFTVNLSDEQFWAALALLRLDAEMKTMRALALGAFDHHGGTAAV